MSDQFVGSMEEKLVDEYEGTGLGDGRLVITDLPRVPQPTRYMRINISRNSKGWNHESTVSLEGALSLPEFRAEMETMLSTAHQLIESEIAQRESIERHAVVGVATRVSGEGIPQVESIADLPF